MVTSIVKTMRFGFEDLEVWHRAIDFAGTVIKIAECISTDRKHYRLIEQLESAAASIPMNIAEGKGRFSKKEFVQFLYMPAAHFMKQSRSSCFFIAMGGSEKINLKRCGFRAIKSGKCFHV